MKRRFSFCREKSGWGVGFLLAFQAACSPLVTSPPEAPPVARAPSPAVVTTPSTDVSSPGSTSSSEGETQRATVGEDSKKANASVAAPQGEKERESAKKSPEPRAFFAGRETVTYGEFIVELRKIADEQSSDPDVVAAHQVLLEQKGLTEDEMPLESFSRVRLAFESARDSGLWGIRGTVTDQMPWSDRIWQQWSARSFTAEAPVSTEEMPGFPTAVAECDEMGALFSILARDLGVVGFVGLHWPYWNHVVPVWQVDKQDGSFVRIIVPATQTFLDKKETIGTTGMKTNRVVFPYVRKDQREGSEMSADLARYLLTQSHLYGGLSTSELTHRRLWHRWNHRPNKE